jgi:hypothetical protein
MDQRDPATRHSHGVLGLHHPAAGATRRCPVQPITPLGPDQVNVLLLLLLSSPRPLDQVDVFDLSIDLCALRLGTAHK